MADEVADPGVDRTAALEVNFDGLVGPTHTHAGLSPGNRASANHAGEPSNPKGAALQGLAKMRFLRSLGLPQAVLPPQERPAISVLRRLGFRGSEPQMLQSAQSAGWLGAVSSASAMWTANAATVVPSADSEDGRVHLVVANLGMFFHRFLEPPVTERVLRRVFANPQHFAVHAPLPPARELGDEGAANHTRLTTALGSLHLFGWGRSVAGEADGPRVHPARQSKEASEAVVRLGRVQEGLSLLWRQHPHGIDAGAFHSDVLAVGSREAFLFHEFAFVDAAALRAELSRRLGPSLYLREVSEAELPVERAVAAYPFNSQLVCLPGGGMAIVAPRESEADPACQAWLARLVAEPGPIEAAYYQDVRGSMANGGGPACLRLRVVLEPAELAGLGAAVVLDENALDALEGWVRTHYRDRLTLKDLADPQLLAESRQALDELTQRLALGSVYDFQLDPSSPEAP